MIDTNKIFRCEKYTLTDGVFYKTSEQQLAVDAICADGENVESKLQNLTQSISKIKMVSSLPSDAAQNTDTLYLVVEGGN